MLDRLGQLWHIGRRHQQLQLVALAVVVAEEQTGAERTQTTTRQECDAVSQVLHLLHEVRGQADHAVLLDNADSLPHLVAVHRVQTRGRLVQEQHLRVSDHRHEMASRRFMPPLSSVVRLWRCGQRLTSCRRFSTTEGMVAGTTERTAAMSCQGLQTVSWSQRTLSCVQTPMMDWMCAMSSRVEKPQM